jgi:poly-gamma-glutamate synthase PgsB/CapB
MTLFLLLLTSLSSYLSFILISSQTFKTNQRNIPWRVHVNGIRGKSSVTRYVSAIFRAAGYQTFGKTTGTAARIIQPNGQDFDFGRPGYANINEQVRILKRFSQQKAEAVVMECMAINPTYAEWLEEKVMNSNIGIITNVRLDHTDYMGETLEEIAESLSRTIPSNGILITSETKPELISILEKNAKAKNTRLVLAHDNLVASEDLEGFAHFAIKENVAIGYRIAEILNVPLNQALAAMQAAASDPGMFNIQSILFDQCDITWANLFAVNDRESFVEISQKLFEQHPDHHKVVILNNRHDRPTRVELFAKTAQELQFDRIVTFGDYETSVNQIFTSDIGKVINLGNSTRFQDASATQLLTQMMAGLKGQKILLLGTVNIHTTQAEKLLHFFSEDHIQPVSRNTSYSVNPLRPRPVGIPRLIG